MAHHVEPMDIDSDFDNKENSLHHNNVLPFTEKGYEELDVSELNMKLRYSVTPASSPMSKSFTANCTDNRSLESGDELNVTMSENFNLSHSLNSTLTKNDNIVKSLKSLPLQTLPTEQFVDSNRNASVLRPLDSAVTANNGNITVTVNAPSDIDENLSLPSSSSSALHTPEATTPTKDIPIKDGGSPIMRGLKSVLNMFRSSQSPIPPADNEGLVKPDILSPPEQPTSVQESKSQAVLASTPIAAHRKKEMSPTKRSSPLKDSSIVFNDDLEKELQWKDETTIIFSQERIPIHKLMLQQPQDKNLCKNTTEIVKHDAQDLNSTVEYMDISYNDSFKDRTITEIQVDNTKADFTIGGESDSEFVDCETTFTKNKSTLEDRDKTPVANQIEDLDLTKEIQNNNDSGSRLKQIILDTTQDILDATLSVRPEDLLPEIFDQTKDVSELVFDKTETIETLRETALKDNQEECSLQVTQPVLDQTVDISNSLVLEAKGNKADDPNCTKTVETTASTDLNSQTYDASNSLTNKEQHQRLDVINVLENILVVTPMLETEESDDINVTKIVDITTNTQTVNETFDVASSTEEHEKENLDVTKTVENVLGVTQILEHQSIIIDTPISNATIILDDNKNSDEILSTNDVNSQADELSPEIGTNDSIPIKETPTIDAAVQEDAIIEPLPIPDDIINDVQDVTMTELPVDIPLPDEDDLDKETNILIDTTPEVTPLASLPLDLVDDIKVTTNINETINTTLEEINANLINNEHSLSEVCGPIINSIKPLPEGGDCAIIMESTENYCFNIIQEIQDNIEQINNENEMSELCKKIKNDNLLPVVTSTSNITNDEKEVVDKEIENIQINETNVEINIIQTVNKTEQINEEVTPSQDVIQIDNVESVSELKPLPDIINQTIATSNNDNSVTSSTGPETVPSEIEKTSPANADDISDKPIILETNDNQLQHEISKAINIENEDPLTKPSEAIEKNKNSIVCPDVTDESSNVVTKSDTTGIAVSENLTDDIVSKRVDDIPAESNTSAVENEPSNVETAEPTTEQSKAKEVEEEIVLSENNSPFVSVIADNTAEMNPEGSTETEIAEDSHATKIKVILTPPSSPPIRSKGYNFNFDDLDFDPFATKTKIRMSPSLDSPNKSVEPTEQDNNTVKPVPKKDFNRRKSQPERKKPTIASKRKFNATFDGKINDKVIEKSAEKLETDVAKEIQIDSPNTIALSPNNVTIEEKDDNTINISHEIENTDEAKTVLPAEPIESSTEISDNSIETNRNEFKPPTSSSSEQSTYYSACTTSSESSIPSKNVFNLPEIDDVNFNPFATKSKMRQSPPLDADINNPFATKSKVMSSPDSSMIMVQKSEAKTTLCEDKIETELMEKDASGNLSNTSKATDERNVTTKEIHTEDEDTVEGPFLEGEDLNADEKMSDFDGDNVDMLQFNELPPQSNEDVDNGEMFIDAEAFEFLLNQNKSNTVTDSGKESLFLKFDPLFAKRISAVSSDGVLASLAKLQRRQSTPTKTVRSPTKHTPSPVAGPSNLNVTQDMDMNASEEFNDDLNITVSKPMMVVPPAVNPVTPRNKSLTPNRSNRRSITFTSPAMAVIDRLLSLSSNNSPMHDTTVTHVSREQNEADIALSQLRELLAEKEINVYNLKCESNELRDRLNTLEGQVKSLEAESEDRLKKINQLSDTLIEKTKINKSMAAVVEEYERTIASLIAETAQDKKKHAEERMKLINERDEQTAHLASMEVSFSDLHSKYEKSKQVILNCKANEDLYKKSIKEFEENLTKMHNNYELLKQHATSKLNHANQELEKINRSHEAEVLKLNAMIKRKELHITSLEESLAQKTKANDELTAICDELINKVG